MTTIKVQSANEEPIAIPIRLIHCSDKTNRKFKARAEDCGAREPIIFVLVRQIASFGKLKFRFGLRH